MKRGLGILSSVIALSSSVFAVGSEINTNFVVDTKREVVNYVPNHSFFGSYLGYFILAFVALAFVYFIVKGKKSVKKKEKVVKKTKKKVVKKKAVKKKK